MQGSKKLSRRSMMEDFDFHWTLVKKELANYLGREIQDDKELLRIENEIDNTWYLTGEKNFSIYNDTKYLMIAYCCFKKYSRGFMLRSLPIVEEMCPRTILDVGAGIGATTAMLANKFKSSKCYYQNLPGEQFNFAKCLLRQFNNVEFINSVDTLKSIDLVVCLELFEHIKSPIDLLDRLIGLDPKIFIISNSFGAKAFGHFSKYTVLDEEILSNKMPRIFNRYLKSRNYSIDLRSKNFWNSRPTIWIKD